MAKIREEFEKWQQQVSTLMGRLKEAEDRAAAAEATAGAKSPEFLALQATVADLTGKLETAEGNLASLRNDVDARPAPAPSPPTPEPPAPPPPPQTRATKLGWV